MTEACLEFAKQYMPDLILLGFGSGSLISIISILTGYSIKQALSFFDK